MSYRTLQEQGRVEVERSYRSRDRRSSDLFADVERFIASRREFDEMPEGDPHLRSAVLYCRSKGLPVGAILTVRKQIEQRWI